MAYNWIQAEVYGEIDGDGHIHAKISGMQGMTTPRPNRDFAASGADPSVFYRLRNRIPGQFHTLAYMGGATAILVPTASILWFSDPKLMERMETKYGRMGELTYCALVRNTGAPTIWNVAEPAGGMAENHK